MGLQSATISGTTVIMSDFHLGGTTSTLNEPGKLHELMVEMQSIGSIETLVLLGDTWECWLATPLDSSIASQVFLKSISGLPGLKHLIFVAGNHDHCFYRMLVEKQFCGDLQNCEPKPFNYPMSVDSPTLKGLAAAPAGLDVNFSYPHVLFNHSRFGNILLDHGHYLDYFVPHWWATTQWLSRLVMHFSKKTPELRDIENNSYPFFEIIAAAIQSPQIGRLLRWLARLFGFTKKGVSPLRSRPMDPKLGKAIAKYMTEVNQELEDHPDIYIFGHTHEPGILDEIEVDGKNVVAINTGGWVEGDSVYLLLTDKLYLRRLGQQGPIAVWP